MSCCGSPHSAQEVARSEQKSAAVNIKLNDLLSVSSNVGNGLLQTDFIVPDMRCAGCINTIERAIGKLDFVERVRVNLSLKRVSVIWHEKTGNLMLIDQTFVDTGFAHSPYDLAADRTDTQKQTGRNLLLALAVAGFGAANIMLLSVSIWSGADIETTTLFHLVSGLIAVPVVAFAGRPFFRSAFVALKAGRLNMDVPISLAVLLALAMSIFESLTGGADAYFDAAVTLLFFLLIGRYLDHLMRDKARDAIIELSRISPKGVSLVQPDGNVHYLPLNEVEPGQTLRILAGEHIPVDGQVMSGSSDLDCSLVTGESTPVNVTVGARIEAGTLNLTGSIDIRALKDAKHSFLAEVAKMMEAAEKGRGRFTRIADQMAKIYAPAVHLLAALAFIGWMIVTKGDWHTSVYIAISVLIITCPCALGLAVPVAHVVAARRLFKEGIIIADGAGLERLEQVTSIIFDKTGTLTTGVPQVVSSSLTDVALMEIARTLSAHSNHPVSKAVNVFLKGNKSVSLTDIHEAPGDGIQALFEGAQVRLGRVEWVSEIAGSRNNENQAGLGFCIEQGAVENFKITEILREDAIVAIKKLQPTVTNIEIMSGDSTKSVRRVADALGISTYYSGQTPRDKISHINFMHEKGEKVLMIGDGLNDGPALAGAHASIAPSDACDVGRQAADFVFTHKSLLSIPFAMKMAKRTGAVVRQNFTLAILYNCIAVPFAVAGYVTPLIAAIAMSASSIVVVANSIRLSRG